MYCKTILFLGINTTFAPDNYLRFRNNLLEKTTKTNHEKLQLLLILTFQLYHQIKSINKNMLQLNKYYLLIKEE